MSKIHPLGACTIGERARSKASELSKVISTGGVDQAAVCIYGTIVLTHESLFISHMWCFPRFRCSGTRVLRAEQHAEL